MKKFLVVALALCTLVSLVACGETETQEIENNTNQVETQKENPISGLITVVSREDGSGTRGAFTEITGVDDGDDRTTLEASIQNSTGSVMTLVSSDKNAIGYISLSSLNDTVKAIDVNGVSPSTENINDGSYEVARPFNIAINKSADLDPIAQEIIDFVFSAEGQAIVEDNGLVSAKITTDEFVSEKPSGSITIGGSTSVTPVMEKLVEAYLELNQNATIDIQSNGSSTGMNGAIDGTVDIGMASRDMKDSELEQLTGYVLGMDGIAVIVNNQNALSDISMDDLMNVYIGEIIDFSELN